jgi:hypothetical protein
MISYTYNADSTLSTKTYNNGNYQQYSYDPYQRLTEIQGFVYNSPQHYTEDTSERQTFTYGLSGAPYAGLLISATFASGLDTTNAWTLQNQYTYTPAGQVATKALSVSNGAATASGLLTTSYTYDGLGTLISTQYPSPNSLTFTYALDGLERPIGLTDNTNHTWVSGVVYNPASQMTNAMFPSGTEMWGYNTLNQLTQRMTTSGSTARMNMTYVYTAGKDNGQVASSTDAVTGETITYQYDSLKRLVNAYNAAVPPVNAAHWSDAYTYDGFGNLTGMTGSGGAPSLSVSVNPATNQVTPTNVLYDSNGNVTQFSPIGIPNDAGIRRCKPHGVGKFHERIRLFLRQSEGVLPQLCGGYGDALCVRNRRQETGDVHHRQHNGQPGQFHHAGPERVLRRQTDQRGRQCRGGGSAGIGAMECRDRRPHILSLWRGIHRDFERYGEVRDLHARHSDGLGLRDEPVLLKLLGKVYDAGPELE